MIRYFLVGILFLCAPSCSGLDSVVDWFGGPGPAELHERLNGFQEDLEAQKLVYQDLSGKLSEAGLSSDLVTTLLDALSDSREVIRELSEDISDTQAEIAEYGDVESQAEP